MISLALVNGHIWTGNPSQPEAEAVAIAGDRIIEVGRTAEIRSHAAGAEVVDLAGRFVVPGFIDSHVHFVDGGFRLTSVQLRDVTLEDLGSSNGTFVRSRKLGSPYKLVDRDLIDMGSATMEFRMWSDERPPRTERLPGRSRHK